MIVQVDNPILEVHDLTVSYDRKPVLWGIDFSLPKGNLIAIVGPNGAGKSTLIKSIMGLIKADSGYTKLFGKSLDEVRSRVSYVPQKESVDWDFPANVKDVVLMGRIKPNKLWQRYTSEDKKVAEECLEKVGMTAFQNRQIAELSGGQQQRVFLARALAQQADFYLMDEPFAGVDAATENAIVDLLKEMRSEGKTIVVVHHDLQSASAYFDWLLLINTRLVASGPMEKTFTQDLLQETYGGQLTLLNMITNKIKRDQLPIREK